MYLDKNKQFLMIDDEDGIPQRFCEAVYITQNVTDLISNVQTITLELYNRYHDDRILIEISRGDLDGHIGSKLRKYGLSINIASLGSTELFYDFLLQTEEEAKHIYKHKQLGFANIDNKLCFLAHKPIGLDSGKRNSEYYVPKKTEPRGSLRSWHRLMRREVIGRPKLELALALGVVAPVAHLLREAGVISDLPMYALVGMSSIGKTIVLRLIGSMYGRPTVGDGLITNMNSTINGLFSQMAAQYGYPALFDEVTGTALDLSSSIYYMPNGRDKVRCNPDGTLREPIEFSGAMFFSSERSLFGSTINTEGLHARLAEFYFIWTASKKNAENLEKGLKSNYGSAVYPLIKWLFRREEWLQVEFEKEYETLFEMAGKRYKNVTNISNRVLKMYALVMVAAKAVSISLNLNLGIKEMRKLLIFSLANNASAVVSVEDEYEELKSFVQNNFSKFPSDTIHSSLVSTAWGFRKHTHGIDEFWVRKDIFENELKRISNRDLKTVLKEFAGNNWIYQDKSRHKLFKSDFLGINLLYYRLRVTSPVPTNSPKPKIKISKQRRELLA